MKNILRKVFGEKLENETYHDREAVYVVVIADDKIAVVKTSSGKLFLPSGKFESGESLEDCVMRECLEKMGAKVIFSIRILARECVNLQKEMKNYFV